MEDFTEVLYSHIYIPFIADMEHLSACMETQATETSVFRYMATEAMDSPAMAASIATECLSASMIILDMVNTMATETIAMVTDKLMQKSVGGIRQVFVWMKQFKVLFFVELYKGSIIIDSNCNNSSLVHIR
jgi:hypothetical protein